MGILLSGLINLFRDKKNKNDLIVLTKHNTSQEQLQMIKFQISFCMILLKTWHDT